MSRTDRSLSHRPAMIGERVILRDGERWVCVDDVLCWLRARAYDAPDDEVRQAFIDAADVINRDTLLR